MDAEWLTFAYAEKCWRLCERFFRNSKSLRKPRPQPQARHSSSGTSCLPPHHREELQPAAVLASGRFGSAYITASPLFRSTYIRAVRQRHCREQQPADDYSGRDENVSRRIFRCSVAGSYETRETMRWHNASTGCVSAVSRSRPFPSISQPNSHEKSNRLAQRPHPSAPLVAQTPATPATPALNRSRPIGSRG